MYSTIQGRKLFKGGNYLRKYGKQKVITQANNHHRVKGDTLKVQNCNELKSSTLGLLRLLRSPRLNNLETQNNENL
jgi:hypothetical protein